METVSAPRVSAPRLVDPFRAPITTAPRTPIPPPHNPTCAPTSPIAELLDIANQMTPDFAKHKCRHFLSALKKLSEEHFWGQTLKKNVKNLIQGKAVK